jgi:mannonate dehydratase
MGEDLEQTVKELADKIFFIHFRNVRGNKLDFSETFHDNGDIDMAEMIRIYSKYGIDVPIRVDHVPTMAEENSNLPGYDIMGRMFAIGYLKGLLEGVEKNV